MLAIVISPNPIITVLVGLGFMLASLQITCNCYIGCTRIMVGMSLDRTLPAWFSKVSSRFRIAAQRPRRLLPPGRRSGSSATTTSPRGPSLTLGVTFAAGYVFVFSSLAAALLPYRAKALYEAAPGAQLQAAGHTAGDDLRAHRLHRSAWPPRSPSSDEAGLRPAGDHPRGYIVVAGIFVACLVVYWIGRIYQKGKGIDVSYAFLEVPPE